MPILEINGRRVEVDDSFLSMTPEQQNATVDEIAQSLGSQQPQTSKGRPTNGAPAVGPWQKYQQQSGPWTKYATPGRPSTKVVEFEGQRVEFPDDFTDAEISEALSSLGSQPRSENDTGPGNMATLPELEDARRNAHAAGDTNAARQLADEIVRLRGGGLQPQTPSARAPAPVNQGLSVPTYMSQSTARGVADVVGSPVDLVAAGLNLGLVGADTVAELFGGNVDTRIEKPIGGSHWLKDTVGGLYESAGGTIVAPEQVSSGVRIAGDAVESASAAGLGSLGLASGAAQTAATSATRAGRWLAPLAQPYRGSVRPVVGDTVAGAGAGAAVGTYEEAVPDAAKEALGPLGPLSAAFIGGLGAAGSQAVAQGAADRAISAGRDFVRGRADPASPYFEDLGRRFSRREMDEAGRAVQAQASNPRTAADRIGSKAGDLSEVASPASMPTTGAMSDDIGLALLEKEARARRPAAFAERDRATTTRAGAVARSAAPEGAISRDFTNTADAMHRDRVAGAKQRVEAAQSAQSNFAGEVRRRAEPIAGGAGQGVAASQRLDSEIVGSSLRPLQDRKNAAFDAVDPDRTVTRDATPLIQAATEIRNSLGRLNDPSSVLPTPTLDRIAALAPKQTTRSVSTGLLDEGGRPVTRQETERTGGTGTITFGELNALRPELAAALVKTRAAGDFALADNIQALQRALNREATALAREATPAGRRAAEAQRVYREEFAPVWNVGPGDEATRFRRDVNSDRNGRTLSPPSATAGRFLRPGQPEKAQSLRRIIDSLPDRQAAENEARRYLTSDLAESGVVDAAQGVLRPDMLRRWRNQWAESLDVVPGFRDEIDGLLRSADADALRSSRMAAEVRAAEANLDDVVRNKGALGLVLGKDPVNAVESVFNAGDPERAMNEVVSALGTNKRATDGLKSSVVDYLVQATTGPGLQKTADGSRPLDFAKLENLFSRHEKTLAGVFQPAEMNAIRSAHKLLAPREGLKVAGVGSRYEAQKSENAWRLLEGGLKAHFGVLKGGGILRTIRIFVASLPRNEDAVNEIIVRMHFDPELATHLLRREVDVGTPQWNAKLNKLLAVATGARESTAAEELD